MNRNARLTVLAAVVVAAAVAFVVLKPGGGDRPSGSTTATSTRTAPRVATTRPSPPRVPRIRVVGGRPAGATQKIRVSRGRMVRFSVVADVSDEVHVHGYDLTRNVAPGRPASFAFPARIEGVFEIELHRRGAQIAELTVTP